MGQNVPVVPHTVEVGVIQLVFGRRPRPSIHATKPQAAAHRASIGPSLIGLRAQLTCVNTSMRPVQVVKPPVRAMLQGGGEAKSLTELAARAMG